MEERLLDDKESRRLKLVQTEDGGVDAVEGEGSDPVFELSGDEELLGLTPSEREEALKERERARKEAAEQFEALLKEGEEKLNASDYDGAAKCFEQALLYDVESEPAQMGLWRGITSDFREIEPLLTEENVGRLLEMEVCPRVLKELEVPLRVAQEETKREEAELEPAVTEAREKRRKAFAANRSYYAKRTFLFFCIAVLFAIGTAIAGNSILRTQSIVPVALTIVFAVLTAAGVAVLIYFLGKFYAAEKLCRTNEDPASTESGARLQVVQERMELLDRLLK